MDADGTIQSMENICNGRCNTVTQRFRGDFWKFWLGQSISTLGGSFTSFALPLLIFKLTGSPLNLALTVVSSVVPYICFGLVIGAWVDRVNRKRLMIVTDVARALVIASIPCAAVLGLLSVWWIYAVSFINSTLTICFDAANFAAVPSLVARDDLVTANGRIQASYSLAHVIGPLLAGLLVALVSLPMLLLIDASSFLVSAASLAWIRESFNSDIDKEKVPTHIGRDIVEGLRYVVSHPVLGWLTLFLLLDNFILPTSTAQFVLFAKQWLAVSDPQLGLLYAGGSLGTMVFSLIAKPLHERLSYSMVALGSALLVGVLTAALVLTHWYWLVLVFWTLRGGIDILFVISSYSLSQTIVPNHLLGRVIIFMRVMTWSIAALGALLGGYAIERTGVAFVYGAIGALEFVIALVFLLCTPLGRVERYITENMEKS
jgi:MFS family permease